MPWATPDEETVPPFEGCWREGREGEDAQRRAGGLQSTPAEAQK